MGGGMGGVVWRRGEGDATTTRIRNHLTGFGFWFSVLHATFYVVTAVVLVVVASSLTQ